MGRPPEGRAAATDGAISVSKVASPRMQSASKLPNRSVRRPFSANVAYVTRPSQPLFIVQDGIASNCRWRHRTCGQPLVLEVLPQPSRTAEPASACKTGAGIDRRSTNGGPACESVRSASPRSRALTSFVTTGSHLSKRSHITQADISGRVRHRRYWS
jgi:hypothetical protein